MNIPVRTLLFVLTASCAVLLCGDLTGQNKNTAAFTVVIDAGHGGKDPGALHGKTYEKDINLAVALKLGKLIEDDCPDVKVVYTRKTDVFLELNERGVIANRAGGDLFISLHADAVDNNSSANGATTLVMGANDMDKNLREAMRENSVIKYEEDYTEKYQGFDPASPESYIIFSLMQFAHFDQSLQFANMVQQQYAKHTGFSNRGIKQQPLYVLWKSAMPSVLTEMGFITNEKDRKYITSEKGQNDIAKALSGAFREYKNSVEKKNGTGNPTATAAEPERSPETRERAGYYVQLCTSRSGIPLNDSRFRNLPGTVVEKQIDGWFKYAVGGYLSLQDAQKVQAEVKKGAYKDAFITAFDGNEQIGMNEAKKRIAAQNK